MRHYNPYRIDDPNNIFDVGENSSHPELKDKVRVWRFKAYSFTSATELHKFFDNEGLNPKDYVLDPHIQKDIGGNKIFINVVHKSESRNYQNVRRMSV